MSAREASAARTRESILDAGLRLFRDAWYEDVTLADVAREAGVSQQTVVNHFGTKAGLYLAGIAERTGPAIEEVRSRAVPGDLDQLVDVLLEDYESTGDGLWRFLASASRLPEMVPAAEYGHRAHRAWVTAALTPLLDGLPRGRRAELVDLAVVATDVTTWHHLRRVQGHGVAATRTRLRRLLRSVLADAA
jgi:AcrR family transcriptional regulator